MTITTQDYDKRIVKNMITVISTQQALLSPKSVADASMSAHLRQPITMSRSLSASWSLPVEAQEKMAKEQELLRLVINDLKISNASWDEFLQKPLTERAYEKLYSSSIATIVTQDAIEMEEIKDNLKIAINDVAEDAGERRKMLMTFYVFLCCDIHTIDMSLDDGRSIDERIQQAENEAGQGLKEVVSPQYGRLWSLVAASGQAAEQEAVSSKDSHVSVDKSSLPFPLSLGT